MSPATLFKICLMLYIPNVFTVGNLTNYQCSLIYENTINRCFSDNLQHLFIESDQDKARKDIISQAILNRCRGEN